MFVFENGLKVPLASGLKRRFATLKWALKHNFATSQSGLKTHNHRVVPIQAIEPLPTGTHAVKALKQIAS